MPHKEVEEVKKDKDTNEATFSSKAVAALSDGILTSCEAELTSVAKELNDFTNQQNDLIEKVSQFNIQGETNPVFARLKDAMDLIGNEMERMNVLRHDMTAIQERSQKLRIRAEKLKSRAEEKERRDEELVAQFVDDDNTIPVTMSSVGGGVDFQS